eukprot:CAMPEP_0183369506 /NCGR_PEP_ID=MMETSP0164_2-20130417/99544_1 /TAXON_ID=221442 /ORGANISM="Coccolithus pelagicus ssp braarudi, Strain PLY182g" /LENGTH=34 /DNA_ID= /DNA_START= /DNA_END= /DNA_ORIENTATION=
MPDDEESTGGERMVDQIDEAPKLVRACAHRRVRP